MVRTCLSHSLHLAGQISAIILHLVIQATQFGTHTHVGSLGTKTTLAKKESKMAANEF